MGKRKELKDNDVEMGGTGRPVEDDESDEVWTPFCSYRIFMLTTFMLNRKWIW
jgi:hypothetical protein